MCRGLEGESETIRLELIRGNVRRVPSPMRSNALFQPTEGLCALDRRPNSWIRSRLNQRDLGHSLVTNSLGGEDVALLCHRGLAAWTTGFQRPGVLAIGPNLSPLVEQAPIVAALAGSLGPTLAIAGVWYFFSPWTQTWATVPFSLSRTATSSTSANSVSIAGTVTPRLRFPSVANVPPTQTCMNCHQVVKRDSELLAPIRASAASGRPMRWIRVHKLPDYAYFAHNAHVAAGIGCVTCHGRIDEMETVTQMTPLSMSWCLDCHRNPGPNRRPISEVTNMKWAPPRDVATLAAQLDRERPVNPPTDCSGCHR